MSKWLKGCEICNAGLVAQVDEYVRQGLSVRAACKLMADEGKKKIGDLVYSAAAIRARYMLHKGIREPNPVHNEPSSGENRQENKEVTQTEKTKNIEPEQIQQEDVLPERAELSAEHHINLHIESAKASQPQKSELEKSAAIIKQAAQVLEKIVSGEIKDNGTEYDRLYAESIRRYLPGIIISAYQLGIDPLMAIQFYKGEN